MLVEPASKRRKTTTDDASVLPTSSTGFTEGFNGAMIKKSWECPELVKRYTVENWEEEMPEDIKKCQFDALYTTNRIRSGTDYRRSPSHDHS
jgi:hypothetical protein